MTDPYVKQIIENEVAYIEFYHPTHNSLPGNILLELVEVITNAGENDQIKVIVLKSGGDRTFCAGASFKELIKKVFSPIFKNANFVIKEDTYAAVYACCKPEEKAIVSIIGTGSNCSYFDGNKMKTKFSFKKHNGKNIII